MSRRKLPRQVRGGANREVMFAACRPRVCDRGEGSLWVNKRGAAVQVLARERVLCEYCVCILLLCFDCFDCFGGTQHKRMQRARVAIASRWRGR
jgi:hypothetical protein